MASHQSDAAGPVEPKGTDESASPDALRRIVAESRAFVDARPAPDLTRAVMSRVEGLGRRPDRAGVRGRWAAWRDALVRPRRVSFVVRPAYGVAIGACLLGLLLTKGWVADPAPGAGSSVFVQFRLYAPDAASVRVAGTFTGWHPRHEMRQSVPGVWMVTLALPPGVHDYAFVVDDDQWVADPYAPALDDGFGGTTSRLALLAPEGARG